MKGALITSEAFQMAHATDYRVSGRVVPCVVQLWLHNSIADVVHAAPALWGASREMSTRPGGAAEPEVP